MKSLLFFPAALTMFVNCFGGYHESAVMNLSNDVIQKHHTLNNHAVTFNRGKFFVTDDNKTSVIKNHDIDTKLRTIDQKKLEAFLRHGYLQLKKYDNGDYILKAHTRGVGGGIGGAHAGFWVCWTATQSICHGAIFVGCRAADLVVPGSGASAEPYIHGWAAPHINTVATTLALTGGLTAAVATGPV